MDKLFYQCGDFRIDPANRRLTRAAAEIALEPKAFATLVLLIQRAGDLVTRDELLDGVWGNEVYVDERTVDVHIGRLRKALVRAWRADPIRTVRGAGYSFEAR